MAKFTSVSTHAIVSEKIAVIVFMSASIIAGVFFGFLVFGDIGTITEPPLQPDYLPKLNIGTANPAAVYCEELGYAYEVLDTAKGQRGSCVLPDGTQCDAWEFLGGECGLSYGYCEQHGMESELVSDPARFLYPTTLYCVGTDGTRTSAIELADIYEKSALAEITQDELLQYADRASSFPSVKTVPPPSFDWRNVDGYDFTTPIKDQGVCGSCWSFGTVAVLESMYEIRTNNPNSGIDLAEEYFISSCLPYQNCTGGIVEDALEHLTVSTIPPEQCFWYRDEGCFGDDPDAPGGCDANLCTYASNSECSNATCENRCDAAEEDFYLQVSSYDQYIYDPSVISETDNRTFMQNLIATNGPLIGGMNNNFEIMEWDADHILHCTGPTGNNQGHAIAIVGYDDSGGYWIIKNSSGIGWGAGAEKYGFMRVAYGECGLEQSYYAVDSVTFSEPYNDGWCDIAFEGCESADCYYLEECWDQACPNGICEWWENSENCSDDCGLDGGGGTIGPTCTDSDEPTYNPTAPGTVSGYTEDDIFYEHADVCTSSFQLRENYCNADWPMSTLLDCRSYDCEGDWCEGCHTSITDKSSCKACFEGRTRRTCNAGPGASCRTAVYDYAREGQACCDIEAAGTCVFMDRCYEMTIDYSEETGGTYAVDTLDSSIDYELCVPDAVSPDQANPTWGWADRDRSPELCTFRNASNVWNINEEHIYGSSALDDYDNNLSNGFCCGDDLGERPVSGYGYVGCANTWNICFDQDGDWAFPSDAEICDNGVDDNCNGMTDAAEDVDGDGYSFCIDDCDDTNEAIHPGVTEICGNTVDDNCNGLVDHLDTDTIDPDSRETDCRDAIDNDCNGLTDGADSQCICDAQGGICKKEQNQSCPSAPGEPDLRADTNLLCSNSSATCCVPVSSGAD